MSKQPISSCFGNLSASENLRLTKKVTHDFKLYYGYLSIPFAGFGLIMSILFIIAVIKAVKQHRVSRKCYVLIINRSIGDAFTCLMAIVNGIYVLTPGPPNKNITHVLDNFFAASFWAGMISYVSLSVLKLYAVARPLRYKNDVTMQRCIHLIIASWVVFVIMLFFSLGITALTKFQFLHDWSGCKLETCLRRMYLVRNVLVVGIYFFTILCYIVTVIYLYRARNFIQSLQNRDKLSVIKLKKFPLWKLSINVGTFAAFDFPYIAFTIITFIIGIFDSCFYLRNYPSMQEIFSIVRFFLLARIIVDPVLNILTDIQIKKSVVSMCGIKTNK